MTGSGGGIEPNKLIGTLVKYPTVLIGRITMEAGGSGGIVL